MLNGKILHVNPVHGVAGKQGFEFLTKGTQTRYAKTAAKTVNLRSITALGTCTARSADAKSAAIGTELIWTASLHAVRMGANAPVLDVDCAQLITAIGIDRNANMPSLAPLVGRPHKCNVSVRGTARMSAV